MKHLDGQGGPEPHRASETSFLNVEKKRSYTRRKATRRRNALKHGLSIPVTQLPYFKDHIEAWHQAILEDLSSRYSATHSVSENVRNLAYELAVLICELQRIAEMKKILSSESLGPVQGFSNDDIIHLMTIIEGWIIPPQQDNPSFDARAMSMLYRIFGIRRTEHPLSQEGFTAYQLKRLSSFERYEERASIRMKKTARRLRDALLQMERGE